jgi:hypothetical protein
MRICNILLCAMLLDAISLTKVHALAGDLTSPSLAMPAETSEAVRTNLMAAISDKEYKFLDGHFINASTTLHYGGQTESLNRFLAKLGECDGVRLTVTFVKEPDGPAWTLTHNGWGAAGEIYIQINIAASEIKMEQLTITVLGRQNPH